MIRVRVTKTKFKTNWYAGKIGEVFEVHPVRHHHEGEELWVVKEVGVTPPDAPYKRIWVEDCELLSSVVPNKFKRLIRVD
jgi:hypothetical protein